MKGVNELETGRNLRLCGSSDDGGSWRSLDRLGL